MAIGMKKNVWEDRRAVFWALSLLVFFHKECSLLEVCRVCTPFLGEKVSIIIGESETCDMLRQATQCDRSATHSENVKVAASKRVL